MRLPGLLMGVALVSTGCATSVQLAAVTQITDPAARRIEIEAGRRGFSPNAARARVGESVTLVFTRTDGDSCLERVVLHVDGDRKIERELPSRERVAITLRLDRPGEVGITCSKGGHGAALVVETASR